MWLERLWHDLRHAVRVFAKTPGFTATAVISIAMGTGANVAVFSALDILILRPPAVSRPGELLTIGTELPFANWSQHLVSYPDYDDIRRRTASFSGFAGYASRLGGISADRRDAPQVKLVTFVNGSFFDTLGVEPILGRAFVADEDRVPGRDAVAVISYGLWNQMLGGAASALGREIQVAGVPFTVIGVLPETFTGLSDRTAIQAVYVPFSMWPRLTSLRGRRETLSVQGYVDPLKARDFRAITLKGRLREGVSVARARAELATLGQALEEAHPDTNARRSLEALTPLQARLEGNEWEAGMLLVASILSIAVLCVACANVAGLLSSRAPLRAREIALRLAIGAGRGRLVRQLITESLCMAIAGGIGGVGVGYAGVQLINQIEYPTDIFAPPVIELDERTLVFSILIALASAVLFGLGPALQTTRIDLAQSMRPAVPRRGRWGLAGRNHLVALQVALSLGLLTIAAFAIQVFGEVIDEGPGFRTSGIAKVSVDAGEAGYEGLEASRFFERLLVETRRIPGVSSTAVTDAMPLFSLELEPIVPDGYRLRSDEQAVRVNRNAVDEDYFETLAIPILAGRSFRQTDNRDAPLVAVVNETFVRRFWPSGDAVGRHFRLESQEGPAVEVVGVARNSRYLFMTEGPTSMVYFPFRQRPSSTMVVLAATDGTSASLLGPMVREVRRQNGNVAVYDVQTIERFYHSRAASLAGVGLSLITTMSVMGMTLTVVGLYALVSYAVTRRTREIGIRIAVGATYARVLRMLIAHGMMPALPGLAVGLGLSLLLMRVLPALMTVERAYDPRLYAVVTALLVAVSLIAVFVPARRAALIDPTTTLRHE